MLRCNCSERHSRVCHLGVTLPPACWHQNARLLEVSRVRSQTGICLNFLCFSVSYCVACYSGPGSVAWASAAITPLAAPGATFQALNPGLPPLPDFLAETAVTTALNPDGNTLLILTSGFNQNLNASGKVDRNTSNEYVFVFDDSGATPHQAQVIQIEANAFDGLTWNPSGNQFYVSGGPDDLIQVFSRKPNGTWQEARSISLSHNGQALGWNGIIPVVAGIEVTNDGRHLLAANYENYSVSAVDLSTGTVVPSLICVPESSIPRRPARRAAHTLIG